VTLTTVVFDLGETLVDETPLWQGWADYLGVPAFTLFGVLGGLVARGQDHQDFLQAFRPGADWATTRDAKEEQLPWGAGEALLYPDVLACLGQLRRDGWRIVVGGNQPAAFQRAVELLDLPVDVVTSSAELGIAKPAPGFYAAIAARAAAEPEECVHVGDRVDNDVVGASAAGMTAIHVVRGPWGHLFADDPAIGHQVRSLDALPALLASLRSSS